MAAAADRARGAICGPRGVYRCGPDALGAFSPARLLTPWLPARLSGQLDGGPLPSPV